MHITQTKTETVIDHFYNENYQLVSFLNDKNEISLLNIAELNFKKSLLLSAASYFETRIREIVINFVTSKSSGCEEIIFFVKKKAIERQYHTYFDWDNAKNANTFFALFGENFKNSAVYDIKSDSKLNTSVLAFLELGKQRNTLVHQNFASFPIEMTSLEIYTKYQEALKFVEYIENKLT
jgi:RiboL-PSP-HEPN